MSVVVGALSLLSLACAPDPKVVAQRTATDVKSLLREAWSTGEQTNSWAGLDQTLAALGMSADARANSVRVPAVSSLDSGTDFVTKRIDRVFAESNIVDKSGGALTFQVRGVDLCTDNNNALDASCAQSIDKLQLRIRATGDLDLALLVGADKAEAFVLEIRSGVSIAVVADLEKTVAAVTALQEAQTGMSVTYRFTATGKVEVRLLKNGTNDFTLSTAVLVPLNYEMAGTDGVTRKVSVGAKNPVASVRIEGPARRATLKYGAGELRYTGLARDLFGLDGTNSRPLDAFLSGADGTLIFEDGKTPRVEGMGFGGGTSTLKSGNDVLLSVDFNKDQGRAVGATWEQTAQGFKLAFTPGLQVNAHVGFGVLASATYSVAAEYSNATYAGSFLAPGKTPTVEFFTRNTTSGGAIGRLVEGELKLSVDDPRVAPRSFAAPMCMGSSSGTATNPFVESFASVACP